MTNEIEPSSLMYEIYIYTLSWDDASDLILFLAELINKNDDLSKIRITSREAYKGVGSIEFSTNSPIVLNNVVNYCNHKFECVVSARTTRKRENNG